MEEIKQEVKEESKNEVKEQIPPNPFFGSDRPLDMKSREKKLDSKSEFMGKNANLKFDEPWNVHFMIGGGTFQNILNFITDINYDAFFRFRKKNVTIISMDSTSPTHACQTIIDKIEFTDYEVKELEKDNDEKSIYIDIGVISEELSIQEDKGIDIYIDTLIKNRYYAICGKEVVWKQLNSEKTSDDSIIQRYKNFEDFFNRIISNKDYQKVIVNSTSLLSSIKSLSKRGDKKKDSVTIASLDFYKHEINCVIKDEVKGKSVTLSGEDVMIYPLRDESFTLDLEYLIKYIKLKSAQGVSIYVCGNNLPLIFECRIGGGRIFNYYLIAPRQLEQ